MNKNIKEYIFACLFGILLNTVADIHIKDIQFWIIILIVLSVRELLRKS